LQNEPIWLSAAEIIDINRLEVEETGERHFLRQPDLLESAAARPINLWAYENEEDIVRLAATLLYGLAKNHAFEQGNKRTALTAALTFIEANGYRWAKEDGDELGHWVEELTTDQITRDEFAERIRPYIA
jgi:death-on-curing protein